MRPAEILEGQAVMTGGRSVDELLEEHTVDGSRSVFVLRVRRVVVDERAVVLDDVVPRELVQVDDAAERKAGFLAPPQHEGEDGEDGCDPVRDVEDALEGGPQLDFGDVSAVVWSARWVMSLVLCG